MTDTDSSDENDESTTDVWDEIDDFTSADPTEDEQFSNGDTFTTESTEDEQLSDSSEFTTESTEGEQLSDSSEFATESTEYEQFSDSSEFTTESTEDEQLPDSDQPLEGDEAPDPDEMFDEMGNTSTVDGEELWDELARSDTDSQALESSVADDSDREDASVVEEPSSETPPRGEQATESVERDSPDGEQSVVDKRVYCQQCPYFTDPPEVHCTHDGTAIVEILEDGQFRVDGCPVVTPSGPDRTILSDDH